MFGIQLPSGSLCIFMYYHFLCIRFIPSVYLKAFPFTLTSAIPSYTCVCCACSICHQVQTACVSCDGFPCEKNIVIACACLQNRINLCSKIIHGIVVIVQCLIIFFIFYLCQVCLLSTESFVCVSLHLSLATLGI